MGRLSKLRTSAKILWRHRRRPKEDTFVDAAFLAGLAAFTAGWGWIFSPLAPIVGGVLLAGAAWMYGSRPKPKPQAREADEPEPEVD